MYTVDKHIWRTAEGTLVEHGHPDAAVLVYPAGTEVVDADAKRLRLADIGKPEPEPEAEPGEKSEPEKDPEPEKVDTAAEEQRAKTRPATKAVPKPSDK